MAGTATRSADSRRSRAERGLQRPSRTGTQRPALAGHNREIIAGQAVICAVDAEHLAQDAELERQEPVQHDDSDIPEHIPHHASTVGRMSWLYVTTVTWTLGRIGVMLVL
jgi:hypothetical protein